MWRAISCALVALMLLAPVAEAGKVLVISTRNTSDGGESFSERSALGVLNSWGVDYDFIRPGAARTEYCRLGVQTIGGPGGTTTQSYVGIVHLGFAVAANSPTSGYWPDSLTFASKWPLVPQVFAGVHGVPGNGWRDDAACSTGIRNLVPPDGGAHPRYVQYLVNGPQVWQPTGVVPIAANQAAGGWYTRGIWRPVVGYGVAASARARARPDASKCSDCDSTGRSASPDSVTLWARYLSASAADRGRVLVYVDWGPVTQNNDPSLFAMAIAMLDSATGGQVITKKQKIAYTVRGMYRVRPSNVNFADGQQDSTPVGVFCRSDSCDTENIAATMDSLNSLGVPITFEVEADSLMYNEKDYNRQLIRRVSKHRVAISSYNGVAASQRTGTDVAGRYRTPDIFGHTRRREVLPPGTTSLPATCSDTDTSIYCLLSFARFRADSVFPGKVSKVLMPAQGDWTPSTITRANSMALDTLLWAYSSLGFQGAVSGFMSPQHTVSRSTLPRGPFGWTSDGARLTVRNPIVNGPTLGTFAQLPTRGSEYHAQQEWITDNPNVHNILLEEVQGMWTGDWYTLHDAFHANHQFGARTRVVSMSAGTLGGSGQGTHPRRATWWHIKWHQNRLSAMNQLAGRTVAEAVTLDELAADLP